MVGRARQSLSSRHGCLIVMTDCDLNSLLCFERASAVGVSGAIWCVHRFTLAAYFLMLDTTLLLLYNSELCSTL